MFNAENTVRAAIDAAQRRIESARGEVLSLMDSYGYINKALANADAAAGELSKKLKEVWKGLKDGDDEAADVMLQDLNRSAADCAELFIKLAAETQRAVEG